jgi:branched-chain amino acid transport system permease protein
MMIVFASELLNGFATGSLYALMGVGLSLILGVLDIPNFAHGTLYAFGAYFAYSILKLTGSFYAGVLFAPFLVVLVGFALESRVIRQFYGAGHDTQLLVLFAASLILQELIVVIWGPVGFSVQVPKPLASAVNLGFVTYPLYRLAIIGVSFAVILSLWFLLARTKLGSVIRAGMENREMVSILGFDVDRIFLYTFGLGAYLAGLAGALATPLAGLTPSMGSDILPICFAIVVIGGLGSALGAIFGGIIVGMCQSLTSIWWPQGANLAIYLAMGLVIMLRPMGVFGTR